MFNPSRDEARNFLFGAWRKFRAGEPLSALEHAAVEVAGRHPEYHALLDAPDRYVDRDYRPEHGETNPFLHLSMHLAIGEQLSIDQPPGIRAAVQALAAALGSAHDAEHEVMDCLGETLWQAQRTASAPDTNVYLDCLRRKVAKAGRGA